MPDVATTLNNLTNLHLDQNKYEEAIKIILPFVEKIPITQKYLQTAINVLKDWELSEEEIIQLITNSEK